MTALPRMSGTEPAEGYEVYVAVGLILGSMIAALSSFVASSYLFGLMQFIWLSVFMIKRFRRRAQSPPFGFVFVPVGLAWGAFGLAISGLSTAGSELPHSLVTLGRIALQEAFLLNLIVGLGSRMIPFLTRARNVDPRSVVTENFWPAIVILSSLNISFFVQVFYSGSLIWLSRAAILSLAAVFLFSILKRPSEKTVLGTSIRLSVLTIIAGYVLLTIYPSQQLALLHVVFIGGYGLLTLMVATRVVLSHGGQPLDIERKSIPLALVLILIVCAAILRGFSFWTSAATLWIAALLIWSFFVGRYLVVDGRL